jgi:hypothetical protein
MSDGNINQPVVNAHPPAPTSGRARRYVYDDGVTTPQPFYMLDDGVPRPAVTAGGISASDVINILDRTWDQNETIDNNTTNAPITRHNIDKTPLHTDGYIITANYVWSHTSGSNDARVELLIDGTVVRTMRIEPKDPNTNQRMDGSLRYEHVATEGVLFNVELRFDRADNANTTSMYNSNVMIERKLSV